jgi:hypothetical protein
VLSGDFAVLTGPAQPGWTTSVAATAANQITVTLCNLTGGNANPNGFTIQWMSITP